MIVGIYDSSRVARRSQLSSTLGALTRDPAVVRIRVRPLDEDDSGRLMRHGSAASLDEDTVVEMQRLAEGNPFYIRELVRHVNESPGWRQGRLPDGIRDVVGRRLDQLSEACVDVLRVASLVGRTFRVDVVEDALERAAASLTAGATRSRARALLDEASTARIVRLDMPAGTGTFGHGLIHEAVLQEVSAATATVLHAAIGTALERRVDPEDPGYAAGLARHFVGATSVLGPRPAARYSMLAGQHAMSSFAFPDAATHFENVLSLGRENLGSELYYEARGRLGQALAFAAPRADKQKAVAVLSEAVDYFLSVRQVEVAAEFALTEVMPISVGTDGEPPTRVSEMIAKVLPHADGQDRLYARLLARQSAALTGEGRDPETARDSGVRARELARKLDDPGLRVAAERALVALEFRTGSVDPGYPDRCRRLITEAARAGDIDSEMRVRFYLTAALMGFGKLGDAARESAQFLGRADEYRETSNLQQALGMAANLSVRMGDWERARELSSRNLRVAGPSWWAAGALTAVVEATGDDSAIARLVEVVTGDIAAEPYDRRVAAILLLINRPGLNGRFAGAAEELVDLRGASARESEWHEHVMLAAAIALAREDREAATELYASIDRARRFVVQPLGIHPDRVLARLAFLCGRREDAPRHMGLAVAYYSANHAQPEHARALADAVQMGLAIGTDLTIGLPMGLTSDRTRSVRGVRTTAESALEFAGSVASKLAMNGLLRRVEDLRTAGGRSRELPGGLSEREFEVLRLVAGGQSNRAIAARLFITENTVMRHLTNVFTKIGVQNRTEAAAYAFRKGLIPG